MNDAQKAYLQALNDMRTIQVHESAIAWLGELIATQRRHAAEDESGRGYEQTSPNPNQL